MTAPAIPSLACGCNQRRGCSLAAMLARFGQWNGVAKHLEEMRDRTTPMIRERVYMAMKLSATVADMKAANRRAAGR